MTPPQLLSGLKKIGPLLGHNSLPRKACGNFQRNAPTRRSAAPNMAGVEPLVEYFVPRSVSEFDLSVAPGDLALTPNMLPLTVRVPRKHLPNINSISSKQREKMVTFEDERIPQHQGVQDVFM